MPTLTIPERVARVQQALGGHVLSPSTSETICDFDQWHNGPGWPGDWNNGVYAPNFDQGPRD